jgi:hypothetical protein
MEIYTLPEDGILRGAYLRACFGDFEIVAHSSRFNTPLREISLVAVSSR